MMKISWLWRTGCAVDNGISLICVEFLVKCWLRCIGRLGWVEMRKVVLGWVELSGVGLCCVEMRRVGLSCVGLG